MIDQKIVIHGGVIKGVFFCLTVDIDTLSGPESNCKKGFLNTTPIFRTGASESYTL